MKIFENLWQQIYETAKDYKVRPDQLFAFRILKEVEKILDEKENTSTT